MATKREADRFIADQTMTVQSGLFVPPNPITVAEAMEEYLSLQEWGALPLRNARSFAKRVVDSLGDRPFQDVTNLALLKFIAATRVSPRRDGRPGFLMEWSINHIIRLTRGLFRWGVRVGYLRKDPTTDLKLRSHPVQKEMTILGLRDLDTLLTRSLGTEMEAPTWIAGLTGLRRGEVLAVRWREDVDVEAGAISVQRGARDRRGGGIEFGRPKTRTSARTVLLPARGRIWLADLEARTRVANNGTLPELVCQRASGAWTPNRLSKQFSAFLRSQNLRHMRFHDLRHSHVAHCIWADMPMLFISKRLGHASIMVTMDTYGHLLPGVEDAAIDRLDRKFDEDDAAAAAGF